MTAITTDGSETTDFQPQIDEYVDDLGRRYTHALVTHPEAEGLGMHFSAFFGAWGNARVYRDTFKGYFHRLKMLGTHPRRNWLFLCDAYGAFDNGTYYLGEAGDLHVERAMHHIIDSHLDRLAIDPGRTVTLGSSMGGTAALKFGLRYDVGGIVAIGPHIDLDTSAVRQDRMAEVAFTLPDGDVTAEHNHVLTRQIRRELAERSTAPPPLFIQSCADDDGVHHEQVLPLAAEWQAGNGTVHLDVRAEGGHTSQYATRALLLDATDRLLDGDNIDVNCYRSDSAFAGEAVKVPMSHRIRGKLKLRARLKRLLG